MFFSIAKIFGQSEKHDLIVFVGQKIEIKRIPEKSEPPTFDTIINGRDTTHRMRSFSLNFYDKYAAKYKVLQLVNGSLKKDTIEFFVFDHHHGEPIFSRHETVLLFVYEKDGQFYHELYEYFDLYLTKNNRWASPYSTRDYCSIYQGVTVKPERIEFKDQVSFSLKDLNDHAVKVLYPEPYYKIENGQAIAVYGNYTEDLFKLRQQTVLKARGLY